MTNSLTLRIRDLAKLGEVIDRSVKLGINQGGEINFTNNDPEAAVTEARKAAMQEAMAKAKTLTEAAGVSLGRVIEISENFCPPHAAADVPRCRGQGSRGRRSHGVGREHLHGHRQCDIRHRSEVSRTRPCLPRRGLPLTRRQIRTSTNDDTVPAVPGTTGTVLNSPLPGKEI